MCENWDFWEFWLLMALIAAVGLLWFQNLLMTRMRKSGQLMLEDYRRLRRENRRLAEKLHEKYTSS